MIPRHGVRSAGRGALALAIAATMGVLLISARAQALPSCGSLNCASRNFTDACGTHVFVCINEGGGLIYCEDTGPTNPKPAGTPCTNDNNPCTNDVCGSYVYMGVTYDSGTCSHAGLAPGTACTDDGNVCTSDVCGSTVVNGVTYPSGVCTHASRGLGASCSDDSNPCTSDVCDGTPACTHLNGTGGSVCGASCIAPGTCCDNPNSCTGGRTCPSAGGSCGCPTGTFDCAGSCISTSTCCNNPNTCAGGKVCSGVGGSCACPAGSYDCGGTCVAAATCCNAPDNCPPPAGGNGQGQCSGVGGSCAYSCNAGYKACGATCIPNAMCCINADCPNDAANNRSGVCSGGGCAYVCNAGFKVCGATCIPNAACCSSTECMNPPSGCYKTQGTCAMGACTYAYNDGAACNADSNACTPNDKCSAGACVADTANAVVCVQRTCHTAPACNTTTGNCDDANLPDATTCGGNGCTAAGTCTTGVCSSPDKDCTALDAVCKVGICDPALPMATNCTTANKMNGLACPLADKCLLAPACSGGSCVGTAKLCEPSGACRVAECNSSTGDCDETVAPVGTSCAKSGACMQNAACNATGECVGDAVPNGSPCAKADCVAAACTGGQCNCLESPDFGVDPQPLLPGGDLGTGGPADEGGGCSVAGAAQREGARPYALLFLGLVLMAARLRRRDRWRA